MWCNCMDRRIKPEERIKFFSEVFGIIESNGYDKNTLALSVVKYCMKLDFDGKHEFISYLIADSYSERYAWDALHWILGAIHTYDEEENFTSEVCSYPQLNDWVVCVTLGKLTRPLISSGVYKAEYYRHWGYVHCTCHVIKQGITAGRNRNNSQSLGKVKNEQLDKLCAAGIVAEAFNCALKAEIDKGKERKVTPCVVLKYYNLAVKGDLQPYYWLPGISDFENILNTLHDRRLKYIEKKSGKSV